MSRIATVFDALSARGRKELIPFLTAGDPYPDATVELMHALVAGGLKNTLLSIKLHFIAS